MNKPIILDYVTERIGEEEKAFFYDYSSDLNIIKKEGQKVPFIDSATNISQTETVTKVSRESDDETYVPLELMTKTEVSRERDDEDRALFLELMTKTFADRERDDEDDIINN